MLKKCSRCHKLVDTAQFYKSKFHKDKLSPWCKSCRKSFYKDKYHKNKKVWLKRSKQYYVDNRERQLKRAKQYRKINRVSIRKQKEQAKSKRIKAWKNYFGKQFTYCEICNKQLKYFSGIATKSVHFDHKFANLPIKDNPSHWLYNNSPTPDKIKIWEQCDFGILCYQCNKAIPTQNRQKWVQGLLKYAKEV